MAAQSLPSATKVLVDIWWIFWLINCISAIRYKISCINASGGEYFLLYTIVRVTLFNIFYYKIAQLKVKVPRTSIEWLMSQLTAVPITK